MQIHILLFRKGLLIIILTWCAYADVYPNNQADFIFSSPFTDCESHLSLLTLSDNDDFIWKKTNESNLITKQQPHKNLRPVSLYLGVIFVLILLLFMLYYKQIKTHRKYRLLETTHRNLISLTQFKLQFLSNQSYELLAPLSVIRVLNDQWDNFMKDENIDVNRMLDCNITQLREQIINLLLLQRTDRDKIKLNVDKTDIKAQLLNISRNFKLIAKEQKIHFEVLLPDKLSESVDSEKVDIIINTLLSIAFKRSIAGCKVKLVITTSTEDDNKHIEFEISDNGQSIPNAQLNEIFEHSSQIKTNTNVDNIDDGLALVKILTELHNGKVEVISKQGDTTTFKIVIPILKKNNSYSNLETKVKSQNQESLSLTVDNCNIVSANKIKTQEKTILIVDNDNDFLKLLQSCFRNHFNTLISCNTQEGLKIIEERAIDLIIIGNCTQKMTSIEFIRTLKGEVTKSHIPIVLTTDNQNEKVLINAYKAGVDSIMFRPLSIDILLTRVDVLLKKREGVFQFFNKGDFVKPSELATATRDQLFIKKFKSFIEERIDDPKLNVQVLLDKLCLSQSQLNRKTKSLLAMSPNDYIKKARLHRGAQIIEANKDINISEVASKSGFNDSSYFSSCFKKEFGVTPRSYQKGER